MLIYSLFSLYNSSLSLFPILNLYLNNYSYLLFLLFILLSNIPSPLLSLLYSLPSVDKCFGLFGSKDWFSRKYYPLFFFLALLSAAPLRSSMFSSCSISIFLSIVSIWLISFLITILITSVVVSEWWII